MNRSIALVSTAALLLLSAPALAQGSVTMGETPKPPAPPAPDTAPPPPAPAKPDRGAFVAGAKVGAAIPFDGLGPMVSGVLEVGYVLPFLKRSFGLMVDVAYTVPTKNGTVMGDSRVDNGGTYTYKLTQKELTISPALYYRLTMVSPRVVPYVGVGPRIYLHQSTVEGAVGSSVMSSPTTEQFMKVGVFVPVGVGIHLGPGELVGEFAFEWGKLDWVATGNSTSMGGNVNVGYRFLL